MIKLTGLWLEKGKNGDFLKGRLNGFTSVLVFPVTEKKAENGPDYIMYLDENEPKPGKPEQDKNKNNGFGL